MQEIGARPIPFLLLFIVSNSQKFLFFRLDQFESLLYCNREVVLCFYIVVNALLKPVFALIYHVSNLLARLENRIQLITNELWKCLLVLSIRCCTVMKLYIRFLRPPECCKELQLLSSSTFFDWHKISHVCKQTMLKEKQI